MDDKYVYYNCVSGNCPLLLEDIQGTCKEYCGEENFASMSENEIKDLIQTELTESGYMYTLGMLKGMYKAGAFNVVEWCTLTMYLDDLNMEILG